MGSRTYSDTSRTSFISMSGFYGHGHGSFSETRRATVPETFDRTPTRSFQNVVKSFLVQAFLGRPVLCLPGQLVWLDVSREGVKGILIHFEGTSPHHQGSCPGRQRSMAFILRPSAYGDRTHRHEDLRSGRSALMGIRRSR